MTNAWTNGPWKVGALDEHGQRIVRQQHIEICTCWHHSVGAIEKEMEANARLIAAAPDMAEALAAIVWFCDDHDGAEQPETLALGLGRLLLAARTALKKARGETP